jgi:diguanylate cyclase (GGDEF)-like protein
MDADQPYGPILVVDDQPTNLAFLSETLASIGLKVAVAVDGASALELVEENPPELILLDVMLPGMNGFEVCTHLKSCVSTQDIPVIFMSALSSTVDKVKGLNLGAVDYITKPFDPAEAIARIQLHLKLRSLTKALQQQVSEREQAEAALQQANQELLRLARLDSLTQIANRRRFDEYLNQMWQQSLRYSRPLALMLCDIDYFKVYNDSLGHPAGDTCLRHVAQVLNCTGKRPADLVARYGGEEFGVILPDTTAQGASEVAERMRLEIERLQLPHPGSPISPTVTLSFGVTSTIPQTYCSPDALIAAADKALYRAKLRGRNRVEIGSLTCTVQFSSCKTTDGPSDPNPNRD